MSDDDETDEAEENDESDNAEMSFTVLVLDSDDKPVEGVKVEAIFSEDNPLVDLYKGKTKIAYTDEDGSATFDCHWSHDNVTFLCRDDSFGPYALSDGDSFTLNV